MKSIVRVSLAALLVLTLAFALASCDMLPPELQDTINGLIGGKEECQHTETKLVATTLAPTCKATGLGDEVCVECSAVITSGVVIPKIEEHTPGDWIVTKDADCVDAGERCKRCTVCKKQLEVEVIPANNNHAYDWGVCLNCKDPQPESTGLKYESSGNKTAVVTGIGECKDSSLVIPSVTPDGDTVVGIAAGAFEGVQIASVIIPDTVTTAGADAFKDTGLKKASAPASALAGVKCITLKNLKVTGSGKIPNDCMQAAAALTVVEIMEGVTEIGNNAFHSCNVLTSLIISSTVTKIGDSAFFACKAISSLRIGTGVKTIGANAFEECRGLDYVFIPASVKSIGFKAFYHINPKLSDTVFEVTTGWSQNGVQKDSAEISTPQGASAYLLTTDGGALIRN